MIQAITWDPSLGIELGFFTIRYYSLMFLIAFSLGFYIMKHIYKKEGIDLKYLDPLFMYAVIATLLGARLGHVIFYQTELITQDPLSIFLPFRFVPEIEFTGFQGLASHGATIGIAIAMYMYSKKVIKKRMAWILDRVVLPISIGGMFVRIGNFLNSEIIGEATHSSYGVVFKQLGENFPRHPAQLYEATGYLILFIVLWVLYHRTQIKQQQGFLFGLFFTVLWGVRFIVEFVKEPQVEQRADWIINTGQLLSLPMLSIGIIIMIIALKRTQKSA